VEVEHSGCGARAWRKGEKRSGRCGEGPVGVTSIIGGEGRCGEAVADE
jgi:uncharacterized low-complexity protein